MFSVSLDGVAELERDWRNALGIVSDGIGRGVAQGVAEGANEARTKHLYKDRTGGLTRAIGGEVVTVTRGGAEGAIFARRHHASFVEEGTRPHDIWPKQGHGFKGPMRRGQSRRAADDIGTHRIALRWFDQTGVRFARMVHHPGSKPYPFMGLAYFKCQRVMLREIERAIANAQKVMTP